MILGAKGSECLIWGYSDKISRVLSIYGSLMRIEEVGMSTILIFL